MRHECGIRLVALAATISLAVSLLTGCGRQQTATDAEPAAEIGVTYHPKKGLLIPADTAKFIGLETVDVAGRPVNAAREISARVFRSATTNQPRALASAIVSAADAALLQPALVGTSVTRALTAAVLRLDQSHGTQSGMVEAILEIEDAARSLSEGEFVSFRFTEPSTNAVISVPRTALLHTTEGDFVYTESSEFFVRAAVKLGRMDGEFVEIVEGLYAGDKVVVRPVMTLWMTELHNVNGGDACCIVAKPKE